MAKSSASAVAEYLDQLPPEKRKDISTVRNVLRKHLPKGYQESVNFGMIAYEVPLSRFPNTYNKRPLMYMALAAQKNHYALYLMCVYADAKKEMALKDAFEKAGKKLDMGKSCVRFKSAADIPLEAIGKIIGSVTPDQYIAQYEAAKASPRKK